MVALETEIKFAVHDPAALEAQLEILGFRLITPRSFESNQLFDTPDRSLRARRELVRIRDYAGRTILTHKRLPDSGVGEDRHKHRIESETEVTDAEALVRVFAALGLEPVFLYEKWRAEWSDGHGHCVIDETPIGSYAELEGLPEWIDSMAAALNIARNERLTTSYGRLFDQWRERTGSTVRDLTFAGIQTSA